MNQLTRSLFFLTLAATLTFGCAPPEDASVDRNINVTVQERDLAAEQLEGIDLLVACDGGGS